MRCARPYEKNHDDGVLRTKCGTKTSRTLATLLSIAGGLAGSPVALTQVNDTQAYTFTTFAGRSSTGKADGVGSTAAFNYPSGLVADQAGNVFVADTYNHTIRKI